MNPSDLISSIFEFRIQLIAIKNSAPMLIQESHRFHFWHKEIGLTQILLLSNVLFIGIIGLVYWYEKRTINRYEHQIAELEEKSLRVFMNPHFFFNALNGIQGLYVSGGLQVTNRYITKLSKLLRFTMELNVNNYITLQEEVDYISNYTDLMRLRTDNKFRFCFDHQTLITTDFHNSFSLFTWI